MCGKETITGRCDKVRSVTDCARNMSAMAGTPYGREGVDVTQCIQRWERAGVEKPLEVVLRGLGFLLRAAKSCFDVLECLRTWNDYYLSVENLLERRKDARNKSWLKSAGLFWHEVERRAN